MQAVHSSYRPQYGKTHALAFVKFLVQSTYNINIWSSILWSVDTSGYGDDFGG